MLLRYLALAILVLLVWYALTRLLERARRALGDGGAGGPRRGAGGGGGAGGEVARHERLLPCTTCGVRVPESRMLADGERRFCSAECRRLAERPPS